MGNTKIPKPQEKGVVRVPVVMQLEALECGAASLTMIMHYYQKWIPLEQARVDCGVSRDGSSAKNIMTAAESYGMIARAWRLDPEDLLEEGSVLMEIKIPGTTPLWLAHLLSDQTLFPTSFSKYGTCYKNHILSEYFNGVIVCV